MREKGKNTLESWEPRAGDVGSTAGRRPPPEQSLGRCQRGTCLKPGSFCYGGISREASGELCAAPRLLCLALVGARWPALSSVLSPARKEPSCHRACSTRASGSSSPSARPQVSRVTALRKAVSFSISSFGRWMPRQPVTSPASAPQPHHASLICWGRRNPRATCHGSHEQVHFSSLVSPHPYRKGKTQQTARHCV